MSRSPNLAARAGRWSATHRKTAIFGWLALVVVALTAGSATGTRTLEGAEYGVGESGRADEALESAFPERASEAVLVRSEQGLRADQPAFREVVDELIRGLREDPGVRRLQGPYAPGNAGRISADGRSALVGFELPDGDGRAEDLVTGTLATVHELDAAEPGFRIEEFGEASADAALSQAFEDDFRRAEVTSLPLTLLILVLAFGALVAAGVPLLLALSAVAAALGLLGPISQLWPADEAISSVVLLIGLAVGVDYSIFYLRREREERAAGRDEQAALEAAAATSGRAVLVSGITVLVAMGGMYLSGASTFSSFATGTILVVAIAMLGSLTVLPAVLAALGDRVNKGRIPLLARPESRAGREPRAWSAVLDRVLRRPLLSASLAAGALLVLAIPALEIRTADPGVDALPQGLEVIQTYRGMQEAFPGEQIPARVVVSASDVRSPAIAAALRELRGLALADPGSFSAPIAARLSRDGGIAELAIPLAGNGSDAASEAALARLREELVPETVGAVEDASVAVTGMTAQSVDFNDRMTSRLPAVFGFVMSMAFLLLLVTFRSIVIPIKAIVLNLLSVAAAYGVVTWIFQEGHLESVLGFESTGSVVSWLPLFMFVILFGLSMDYHVFILTRVREAFDHGLSTGEAISRGIKSTATVITAAAVVMVGVFGVFATLSSVIFKEFGVGLAVAVLVDATVIRAVLLPASMKLLGDWNWYLPRWLEWLPRVSPGRRPPAEEVAPRAAAPARLEA